MATQTGSQPFPDLATRALPAWRRMPRWTWVLVVLVLVWSGSSANAVVTVAALSTLFLVTLLLWRHGEPPVLLFACAMQWVQTSAAIFYTNSYGSTLQFAFGGPELERATWLSLGGVLALGVGMRLALIGSRGVAAELAVRAANVQISRVFLAHIAAFAVSFIAAALATRIPGLAQMLRYTGSVKWICLFVLAVAVLEQRRGYMLLLASVLAEFATGIVGYFAGFKEVFFVLLIAALASPHALRARRLGLGMTLAAVLVILGSVWTAVKTDYREFLNQGFGSQEVLVPVEERVGKLQDLVAGFEPSQLLEGFEALVLRLSYVQYFALTLANVPAAVPHENGALWLGALKHIVTPRLFFPDKPAIDDSARTTFYTGMEVAGAEQGTSISLGYYAESYIDFGAVLMFLPIMLLGLIYGLIYRFFVLRSKQPLIGAGIATAILVFGAYTVETSNIKVVGGNTTVLILLSALYLLFGRQVDRWITRSTE